MKPSVRLPDDPGPNPYDSATTPKDLPKNEWLVSWKWWLTIAVAAAVMTAGTWWRTRGG